MQAIFRKLLNYCKHRPTQSPTLSGKGNKKWHT